ncbi:dihydroorotate dehydrogenase electron transfer subunit [bacterium]|nr:dihydroorotate dehydrogenase electron transfer subunit [bacterium]
MKDSLAKIEFNKRITGEYFLMGLQTDWADFVPGQFVMVDIPGEETFLRRPFGIVNLQNGLLTLCYKLVGKGTSKLASLKNDDRIKVLGPLGNGFELSPEYERVVLVAGGYGVAPLYGLARRLVRRGTEVAFFYGGKSSIDLVLLDEIKKLGVDLQITTDDGSKNVKGKVTELLEQNIGNYLKYNMICACGPRGLLITLKTLCEKYQLPLLVSTEAYMSCGIGLCLGCVCKDSSDEYVRVCKEGPVFNSENLELS